MFVVPVGAPITVIRATVTPPIQAAGKVVLCTGRALSIRFGDACDLADDEHVLLAMGPPDDRMVNKGRLEAARGVMAVVSIAGTWRPLEVQSNELYRFDAPVAVHAGKGVCLEGIAIDFSHRGMSVAVDRDPVGDTVELECSMFGFAARLPATVVQRDLSSRPVLLHIQWDDARLQIQHNAFIRNIADRLREREAAA
jgi:hypothetical protein